MIVSKAAQPNGTTKLGRDPWEDEIQICSGLKTDTKRWQKVTRPLTRRAKYQGRDSQDELLLMLSRRNVT
jgi:hypothetical protein